MGRNVTGENVTLGEMLHRGKCYRGKCYRGICYRVKCVRGKRYTSHSTEKVVLEKFKIFVQFLYIFSNTDV